jgi:hypothetical protein
MIITLLPGHDLNKKQVQEIVYLPSETPLGMSIEEVFRSKIKLQSPEGFTSGPAALTWLTGNNSTLLAHTEVQIGGISPEKDFLKLK